MKGFVPLVLGIFGTFTFSWVGLILIPNLQIGHLDPQSDEEGTDVYPVPKSGMADRGRKIYAANGCIYCHSQQVRADYAASDIDRKWGERRSAPRDYIFARPVLLGKMRMGPDLSNIGKRAPAEEENPSPAPSTSPAGSPAAAASPGKAAPAASPAPSASSPAPAASPPPKPANSPAASASPVAAAASPAASPAPAPPAQPARANQASPGKAAPTASPANPSASPKPANSPATSPAPAGSSPPAAGANPAPAAQTASVAASPTGSPVGVEPKPGEPRPYSAAWHHRHLYSPRSFSIDSDMPAYRFLYEKRPIAGEPSAEALKLTGRDAAPAGWEIVPTYDAQCLVAYLMSLDQSHPLKEVKSPAAAGSPAVAPAASPAASPAGGKGTK
jgi:cbb3-type cytochrome oxidase cytochrome c subunit